MAAGANGAGYGWLVEIYGDPISMSFAGFEPVLRSLVTVAVTGGGPALAERSAEGITLPASRLALRSRPLGSPDLTVNAR